MVFRLWRMGYSGPGGWGIPALEDGVFRPWRMGYSGLAGWAIPASQDGLFRLRRMGYSGYAGWAISGQTPLRGGEVMLITCSSQNIWSWVLLAPSREFDKALKFRHLVYSSTSPRRTGTPLRQHRLTHGSRAHTRTRTLNPNQDRICKR